MVIKLKLKKAHVDAILPKYAKEDDAALDLHSVQTLTIKPGERVSVPTGICMAIPVGYVGLIWDKSGLASKKGIKTMAGVIDAGYRGEVGIVLQNLGSDEFIVEKNMKIAQMLIQPIHSPELEEVEELDETKRGDGGFGSSGK